MNDRVEALLRAMTLAEKVAMAAGSDLWHTTPVERLGIPRIKVTDGPNGARGASWDGPTSACFPCGTALAATWNTALVCRVGVALAREARDKGAHVLLAPTVNIHRSPLAGRNFECYSEDPYLSARMAVAYIEGVQSSGVGATVKHFVCNDSEFERMSLSCGVGERALREIYLPPFVAAVREAGVWALMAAYNRINGVYAAENEYLLRTILKGEWEFDGVVMSDWFGTRSTAPAANAGLDLEMPGPPRFMGERLLEAARAGEVSEAVLDDKVRRLLRLAIRTGALDAAAEPPEQSVDRPKHQRLARAAAGEAIVLLKNEDDLLPLDPSRLRSLAVIGPNATRVQVQGGGSAQVNPHYRVNPLDAIRELCGEAVAVGFEPGCVIDRYPRPLSARQLTTPAGEPGILVEYFANQGLSGSPGLTQVAERIRFRWLGGLSPDLMSDRFSLRGRASLTPAESGVHRFRLASSGPCRLLLDGALLIDGWEARWASAPEGEALIADVALTAGQTYDLRLEFATGGAGAPGQLVLGCALPEPEDLIERAEALAARSDAAILVVGTTSEWETEGSDRVSMELPGRQTELIERVAAANPRTIVVVNAGSPVTMDWAECVPAILQAWFGGQEAGTAVADVIFGEVNPSGKLPTTFPMRIEDNPAYLNYPGENGEVLYGEGIFVGYRGYQAKRVEPRFCFGHGLSYTRFEYGALELGRTEYGQDEPVQASIEIRNAGTRAGQETVQLYVHDAESRLVRPPWELKAFAKIRLEPGDSRTVRFSLDRSAFSYWDPSRQNWVAEPGAFVLAAGSSSRDLRSRASFVLREA